MARPPASGRARVPPCAGGAQREKSSVLCAIFGLGPAPSRGLGSGLVTRKRLGSESYRRYRDSWSKPQGIRTALRAAALLPLDTIRPDQNAPRLG